MLCVCHRKNVLFVNLLSHPIFSNQADTYGPTVYCQSTIISPTQIKHTTTNNNVTILRDYESAGQESNTEADLDLGTPDCCPVYMAITDFSGCYRTLCKFLGQQSGVFSEQTRFPYSAQPAAYIVALYHVQDFLFFFSEVFYDILN